jgi:hypothetical protein
LPGLALNPPSSCLHLLSSWDCTCGFFRELQFLAPIIPILGRWRQEDLELEAQPGLENLPQQNQNKTRARCQWLTSVILATQEAKIRRMVVGIQPREIV